MESREFTEARNDPGKTKPVARTGRDVSGKAYHSIDPKTAAVVSRSGEQRSLDQRCSDLEGCRYQSEDGMRSVWPPSATSREGQRR